MARNIQITKRPDIAKNAILVLLILTIILSAISTWVVLDALNNVKQQYLLSARTQSTVSHGQINVGIMPNPNTIKNNTTPRTTLGSQVKISIVKP